MDNSVHTRLADMASIGSAAGWGWATFAHVNEVLQFIALLVAIVSGTAAAIYHYSEWKRRKNG